MVLESEAWYSSIIAVEPGKQEEVKPKSMAEKLFDVVVQLTQHGKIKGSTTETPMQHKNGLNKSLGRSDDTKRRKRGWPNFLHDFFLKNTLVGY